MIKVVSGSYKVKNGDYESLAIFNVDKQNNGAQIDIKVTKALKDFYTENGLNPFVSKLKITIDEVNFTLNWEATIEESLDGMAYVNFISRSNWGLLDGTDGAIRKTWNQSSDIIFQLQKAASMFIEISYVADYNFKSKTPGFGIRGLFVQYTDKSYKNLKKVTTDIGTIGVEVSPDPVLPDTNGQTLLSYTKKPEPPKVTEDTTNTTTINKTPINATVNNNTTSTPVNIPVNTPVNTPVNVKSQIVTKKQVTGKLLLSVKSGPGQIIGPTEFDINNGQSKISDIEFSEPGDYLLTISSTSPNVNPKDIKVTILPNDVNDTEQPQKGKEEQKPTQGDRPIISQVDGAKVDLPPMEFDNTGNKQDDRNVASSVGVTPFINYMGFQIEDRSISSLRLFHDGIIPSVTFTFTDAKEIFKSIGFPEDDTKFELFLNARSSNLKSIHLKFKIEDFKNLKNGKYTIYGTLDISDLYRVDYKSYTGTSLEALRQICSDMKVGFNTNITNTNDSMSWRNVGMKKYKFINEIIKHSYLSDESYMVGYIDYYWCFNYVDVEKEIKRDISNDVCIDTGNFDDAKTPDIDKVTPLTLISDKGMQNSNRRIIEKSFENNSTAVSLEKGYKTKTKYYDKATKSFLVFDVDSTTSDESKSMILKGAKGDKESFDNNYITQYTGKIDTDNVHKNYNYAVTQNQINLDNLSKIVLKVELPSPNYTIYLYQKINVTIINDAATPTNKENINYRKSGEYIISEIDYVWNGKSLRQELTLIRKELGKNPDEVKDGVTSVAPQDTKNSKQENPLPVGATSSILPDPANAKYTIGDKYTVEGIDGKRYILTITSLLTNGNEVTAKLQEIKK